MAVAAPDQWKEGCNHYKRNCKLLTPCCGSVYSCRFCHDEKEDHALSRDLIIRIVCNYCSSVQPLQRYCGHCGIQFGTYICLKCPLFDNEDKGQFHCNGCGICRVGGRENFYHCKVCNMCLALRLFDNHTCVENASRGDCPVCMEDIHSSRDPAHVPLCGHLLHNKCFDQLKQAGRSTCPICQAQYV